MQVEMKKLLLLGAAVAGLATAQAQITVHPRGEIGVNVSNLSVKVNNKSFDQESKSLADFRVGVAAEIALPVNVGSMTTLYVAPGLLIRQLGAVDKNKESSVENKVRINTLTVPVNLGLRVALNDLFAVSLEAGPNFSYALSAKSIAKSNSTTIERNLLKEEDGSKAPMKTFEVGVGVSAALEYNKYFVRVGADLGLNNLSNIEKNSVKTSDFHFGVGYRF